MRIKKKTRTTLDGKTWARYSISIWSDLEKDTDERKLGHPAMFPRALAARLVEIFSVQGDMVLDPFAGSGSTLAAAQGLGRTAVGFEISPQYADLAKSRLQDASDNQSPVRVINEDARLLKDYLPPDSVALCVTSPPYWNILGQKRTADYKDTRTYGDLENDLSLLDDYGEFIRTLGTIFGMVYDVLIPGGYLVVNVMDIRRGATFFPLHMDLSLELSARGYTLDDIIIWDRRKQYNNLRPLGYPYVFRVNKVHEFLLIFQKRMQGI